MSSHHIVREKQEPALVIANGQSCSEELLGELLEWNPTVIVLDGALERVLDLGIKIDVVLGDFDSVKSKELAETQYPVKVVYAPDQEYTDLEKAVMYLVENGYPAANIVWATGRRTDHTFTNISILPKYLGKINLKIFDDYGCIFPVPPLPKKFEKWYPKGSFISLVPMGTVSGIVTQNLLYSLNDESLVLGFRNGTSNEAKEEGLVSVEFKEGHLVIIESFEK